MTGKDIDAVRAERIGLVNEVYGQAALDAAHELAHELARQIADNPPLLVRGVKGVLELHRASRVDFGLRHVSAWNAAFLPSEDFAEAVRAFSERCPPQFTGR
jgi:enoyl-CoA hydratase